MKISIYALILIITFSITINGDFITLGDNNPEEGLIYPGKILEGPDKNIYVYDSQDAFIKVFSPEGKLLRKLGGKGEGPGQFKRADAADFGFTPDNKSIYFTEYFQGHKWITFLGLTGKLKNTLKYNFGGFYGISRSTISGRDMIFLQKERPGRVIRKKEIYYVNYISEINIMNSLGNITSTVLSREFPQTISFIKMGGDTGIPFTPMFLWKVTKQGDVIFTDGTTDKLEVYGIDGKLKRRVVVPVGKPIPVTKEDLDHWRNKRKESYSNRDKSWYRRFGSVVEKYTTSVFKYKPVILNMSLTPAENILLRCISNMKNIFKYILVDKNGKLLIEFFSPFSEIKITENYFIVRSINDDEETIIIIINREGAEETALKRVKNLNL